MLKIKKYKIEVPVYDLKVEGTENFYAGNILVHNCSEIALPSTEDESFVCDLSSVNLLHYDDWKDTDLVETVIYFLDAVMTDFINKAKNIPYLDAAYNFAVRHRALGLGVLGWHSLLQSKMVPFESMDAKMLNVEIFKLLDKKSMDATKSLAAKYGEPEVLKGYGQRNTTRLAVAPTTSCATPDTRFLDQKGGSINFFDLCKMGGLDINKVMSVSKTWYQLKNPVKILTDAGVKEVSKLYFNGFEKVYEINISDGLSYKFTKNHKLKIGKDWKRVEEIKINDVFNNGLSVISIFDAGVCPTVDIEVPDVHYYILDNGVHSHNSSFILGQVSPSIEPLDSNYFIKDLAKGKFTFKNLHLKNILLSYGKDDDNTWESVLVHGGSVQHLDFLSKNDKDVFKTFGEISQKEVVIQASARQKYIDQGQSLNLMVPMNIKPKEVSDLLIEGWRLGIKTFYYQRGANPAQTLSRSILTCQSCEA